MKEALEDVSIPAIIIGINGRRVRNGDRVSWPIEIRWSPSRQLVGGKLVIVPHGDYPAQYTVVAGQATDGSLYWWLRRWDTKGLSIVKRTSLRYSCDCHGFVAHGHCRHSDAVAFLDTEGFFKISKGLYVDC